MRLGVYQAHACDRIRNTFGWLVSLPPVYLIGPVPKTQSRSAVYSIVVYTSGKGSVITRQLSRVLKLTVYSDIFQIKRVWQTDENFQRAIVTHILGNALEYDTFFDATAAVHGKKHDDSLASRSHYTRLSGGDNDTLQATTQYAAIDDEIIIVIVTHRVHIGEYNSIIMLR